MTTKSIVIPFVLTFLITTGFITHLFTSNIKTTQRLNKKANSIPSYEPTKIPDLSDPKVREEILRKIEEERAYTPEIIHLPHDYFEKELLEDPLSCRVCGGPQNFIKNYEINKLPYVLILSLKRFKYNENNNFKLKQLITYPVDNFQLKDKKYNLFGVVYHYGSINSGHYICSIRHNKKWIVCDDNSV